MRLLGLDPGLRRTGWGVIEVEGDIPRYIAGGVVHTQECLSLAERLVQIYNGIKGVIELHSPDEAAVEEVLVNCNPVSTLKLGQARGVVLLAPAYVGMLVSEYKPTLIKKAIVGVGCADKIQVSAMVERLLLISLSGNSADTADALAVAICHARYRVNPARTVDSRNIAHSKQTARKRKS